MSAYLLDAAGDVGSETARCQYAGNGPRRSRQEGPHAHQVVVDPNRTWLYVPDLGSDCVWVHPVADPTAEPIAALRTPPGSGPRHMAFSRDGRTAFVLCELEPVLITVTVDQSSGMLTAIDERATVSPDRAERTFPSAVRLHPSGRTIAVANRFDDTITVFAADGSTPGATTNFPCRGRTPRDIAFSPDGRWLLVANQDSHDVQFCSFDPERGSPTGSWAPPFESGSPSCIVFADG